MAVYKNLVIPRPNEDGHVDMSLRAAEKARKASEVFVQKVNELIPEDPQKYHKDLLKGIDGKLALLKKNVAYLVLQNLTLIDKLMDAENTVHQVRSLHEIRNNWKDRPNTFAAPDTPTEDDYSSSSDRTKCESWCNPTIDFVIYDNVTDLQSRKLSLTNQFVTNRLRQYIIREDMISFLEPHLATFLFPNQYKDKDSDNDSGTGEEIASPDEFETSNNKFDCSSIISSSDKLNDLGGTSIISNGNFSVSCSRGIIAEKSGDKIIGIVQSVELESSSQMENNFRHERGIPEKTSSEDDSCTMTEMNASRYNSACLGNEFKRRGYAAIGNSFSEMKGKNGDVNDHEEEIAIKKDLDNEKTSTKDTSNVDVIRKTRYSSIRGSFEKDTDAVASTNPNDVKKQTVTRNTSQEHVVSERENKGMRSKVMDQVTTMFNAKLIPLSDSESNILQKQDPKETKKQETVLSKSTSLNTDEESSVSAYPNINRFQGSVEQRHYGKLHRKQSINESVDGDYISIDRKTSIHQEDERRSSITTYLTDLSDKRKNFSSKVSRGNKLRKSKRIEETHKIFESNTNDKDGKQLKPDPMLRFATSINKNPFSENKQGTDIQRNTVGGNKYVTVVKQSDKNLSRLGKSQGDLAGP